MCMLYLDLKISKDSSSSLSTVCLTTAIWNVNHIKKVSLFWKSCRTCIRSTFEGVLIKKQKQREMKTLTSAVVQGTKIWKLHVFLRSSQASPQWQSVCKVSKRASLFVASLEQLCSLLFPLDHICYSGWIPVFIHELKLLKVPDPCSCTISQLRELYYSVVSYTPQLHGPLCGNLHLLQQLYAMAWGPRDNLVTKNILSLKENLNNTYIAFPVHKFLV